MASLNSGGSSRKRSLLAGRAVRCLDAEHRRGLPTTTTRPLPHTTRLPLTAKWYPSVVTSDQTPPPRERERGALPKERRGSLGPTTRMLELKAAREQRCHSQMLPHTRIPYRHPPGLRRSAHQIGSAARRSKQERKRRKRLAPAAATSCLPPIPIMIIINGQLRGYKAGQQY